MKNAKNLYGAFQKVEEMDDGTIKVWGIASSEEKDSDGEIITASAMKAAIPDYMKFGAVREMHQPIAAGTAIEIEVMSDGRTSFGCHVVDPVAVKKVQTGVYKGFSIGGGIPKDGRDPLNKAIINKIKLTEISLVDRPSNPGAVFELFKVEKSETEEDEKKEVPADDKKAEPKKSDEETDDKTTDDKKKDEKEGETPAEKLAKSMWDVTRFSELLGTMMGLACCAKSEADFERDNSQVPAALKQWVIQGVRIFQQMTLEESNELLADLERATKGEKSEALKKVGATFNSKNKKILADLHETVKACCQMLDSLGYSSTEEAEKIDKMEQSNDEILAKAQSDLAESLQKINTLEEENGKLKKKFDDLPAPAKGSLLSVSKEGDSLEKAHKEDAPPPEGTAARAEWEMRKVFKEGGKTGLG